MYSDSVLWSLNTITKKTTKYVLYNGHIEPQGPINRCPLRSTRPIDQCLHWDEAQGDHLFLFIEID